KRLRERERVLRQAQAPAFVARARAVRRLLRRAPLLFRDRFGERARPRRVAPRDGAHHDEPLINLLSQDAAAQSRRRVRLLPEVFRREVIRLCEDVAGRLTLARPEQVCRARHKAYTTRGAVERLRLRQLLADERGGARRVAEDLRPRLLCPRPANLRADSGGREK